MSHYQNGQRNNEAQDPLVWERVTWRQGDGRYVFEVEQGGLVARLTSPHGTSLILPMVAWEGLLDALTGARKTRTRSERAFPARSGARWYEGEAAELAAAFKAGRSIAQLARAHNRSAHAVEAELDRLGLWDREARQPRARLSNATRTIEQHSAYDPLSGTQSAAMFSAADRE